MKEYRIQSKQDSIKDAICYGNNLNDALCEIIRLNNYWYISESDWNITENGKLIIFNGDPVEEV